MTITEIYPALSIEEPTHHEEVIYQYEAKIKGHEILIVGEDDFRVPAAIEIEVQNMVEMGDLEHEARDSFADVRNAKFILDFDMNAPKTPDNIRGVIRITPYSDEVGIRSINDLAKITDEPEEAVARHYVEESGCRDVSKVIDITSLAIAQDVKANPKQHFTVANNLMFAVTELVLEENRAGNFTNCIAFMDVNALEWLRKWGIPFQDFNGYKPMLYDTYKSGTGIIAQPGWIDLGKLEQLVQAKKQRNLARVSIGTLLVADANHEDDRATYKAIA